MIGRTAVLLLVAVIVGHDAKERRQWAVSRSEELGLVKLG
jgi:hypothetical protein